MHFIRKLLFRVSYKSVIDSFETQKSMKFFFVLKYVRFRPKEASLKTEIGVF